MRRARSPLCGLLVAGACAVLATASCFPDYTFLPAGATPPDGGDGAAPGPDATADVAADGPGTDTRAPDGMAPGDATLEGAPPESGPGDAAPPDASEAGSSDSEAPFDGAAPVAMVPMSPGSFTFDVGGSSVHATLTYTFLIDAEEVTVARFKAWVGMGQPLPCSNGTQRCALDPNTPYDTAMFWDPRWNMPAQNLSYTGDSDCDLSTGGTVTYTSNDPNAGAYAVTCVNWAQAAAFCAFDGKRLPTTTEWYYVATGKGQHATEYPWGSNMPTCQQATTEPCAYPVAAGSTGPQIYGVFDLIGGVSEWTWDAVAQGNNVVYPPDATNYPGFAFDGGGGVTARNSFWINSTYDQGPTTLDAVWSAGPMAEYGYPNLGFRCAKTQ
jgi:formylglycine-generating enzyme required for sulfatase activity